MTAGGTVPALCLFANTTPVSSPRLSQRVDPHGHARGKIRHGPTAPILAAEVLLTTKTEPELTQLTHDMTNGSCTE